MESLSVISPFCENQKHKISEEAYSELTSAGIVLSDLCNPVFQFDIQKWKALPASLNFQPPKHIPSFFISIAQDKFYPPPQV